MVARSSLGDRCLEWLLSPVSPLEAVGIGAIMLSPIYILGAIAAITDSRSILFIAFLYATSWPFVWSVVLVEWIQPALEDDSYS